MTAERLLRLLSLFTVRRAWGGEELARRLGVTTRTIRRDVGRLRDLGYEVRAVPGPAGGYELGAGAGPPPLMLDDDAAVDERRCLLITGSDHLDAIAMHLAMLGLPFTPLEPPRLRERCAELSRRLREAAEGGESAADVQDN
jgi:biotin operon repressor